MRTLLKRNATEAFHNGKTTNHVCVVTSSKPHNRQPYIKLTSVSCPSEQSPQNKTQSRSWRHDPWIPFWSRILPRTFTRQYRFNNGTNCDSAYSRQLSPILSAFLPKGMQGQNQTSRPGKKRIRKPSIRNPKGHKGKLTGAAVAETSEKTVRPFPRHD